MSNDDRLRDEARRRLARNERPSSADLHPDEMREELEVHGIELEMQTDELLRTGEALERSRDAYAELFELAPLGFIVLDAALRIVKANRAARRLVGTPAKKTSFVSLVRSMHRGEVAAWLGKVTRETVERDLSLEAPPGTRRLVRAYARRDEHDFMLLSLVDVTETRKAQDALESRERDLQRLTDLAPDAVCVVAGRAIVYANHQFEALVGIDRARLQGNDIHDLVHPDDHVQLDSVLTQGNVQVPQAPLRFLAPDGTARTVELRTMRLHYAGQGCVLVIGRDLTERRRLQSRVERAERLATVGMLVAGVAHEINNPLAYTISNLEVLAEHLETAVDHDLLEAIRDARAGAERVKNIVGDLRAFNRVDDEVTVLEPNRVVMHALRMAERGGANGVRIRRDLGMVANLEANENRLVQVVVNLVVNAAQAMADTGTINPVVRVRTWSREESVYIAIEDNGPGIAKENLNRIFDPFFTTRRIEGGTGLGLAICNSLVQQMGGFIDVSSTLGVGTRFVVRLPASDKDAELPLAAARPRRIAVDRRLRIVVIDDEKALVRSIRRLVNDIADVVTAHSGRQGIQLLRDDEERIDLILCDLVMSDGTGEDVGDWLRTARPDLRDRLVYMTGMAHPSSRDDLGAPVLTKPFTREALDEVLSRVAPGWSIPPLAVGDA